MGFLSSLGSAFGLGGNNSGGDAAAASNEFLQRAIGELRRQFNETQDNLSPFIDAGRGLLPDVIAGATPEGLDANLASIFGTDTFGSLVDERTQAIQGQLSAGGLTRSGTALEEIANIPTSIGLALEELLTGRQTGLVGSGQNAAAGLGSLGAQTSNGIASLFAQQGSNLSSGILTDAQAQAAGTGNFLNAASTAAGIFFSDPALKENVVPVSNIRDLTIYQWDWIPEAKGTMIEECGTVGFMADEVKDRYPHHVSEYAGFMVIDYPALLDELEAA